MSTYSVDNKVALVTGAAGGIGRALATALAVRGCHLALADVDAEGLAETAAGLSGGAALQEPPRVSRHVVDVADRDAVARLPKAVQAAHAGLDLLVNNAGVAIGGTFEQASAADFEWLFEINFWGTVRMTRAFLPLLRASDDARIVNLSSIFGIVAPIGQTAYSASKFAVRGFSEALRHELEEEGASVGVSVVHPGGVATRIAERARLPADVAQDVIDARRRRIEAALRMPPARAAEAIVEGVRRRRARILVGADARVAALLERLAPIGYWRLLRRHFV